MDGETLAIDIETASPFQEPTFDDFEDTDYFELVAIALGYQSESGAEVETGVLFRKGGWEEEYTTTLLSEAIEWCEERKIARTLTYNGDGFDAIHLRECADQVELDIESLLVGHEDLKHPGNERNAHRVPDWKDFPKFEDLCEWEDIETNPVYYEDYDIDSAICEHDAIDTEHVEGRHIGKVLGESYVDALISGKHDASQTLELKRLMRDYATADIEPLFELDRVFRET